MPSDSDKRPVGHLIVPFVDVYLQDLRRRHHTMHPEVTGECLAKRVICAAVSVMINKRRSRVAVDQQGTGSTRVPEAAVSHWDQPLDLLWLVLCAQSRIRRITFLPFRKIRQEW